MTIEEKKLDNPVWYSLAETHQRFSIEFNHIRFYHPDYCPFGGSNDAAQTSGGINQYADYCEAFYIVGEKPTFQGSLILKNELVCNQMIIPGPIKMNLSESIVELRPQHAAELFQLVNLVQPGYFRSRTSLLGSYFGIFKDEKLIAVTGERMKMNHITEVSAVVTHPDHTGKGYAKQLVAHTVNNIFNQNKIPYLHVAETNTPAIKLYERLGFNTRRKISFWNLVREEKRPQTTTKKDR